jgi:hypothetical protein
MVKAKKRLDLSILEAVDNLASMADVDLEEAKKDRHVLLEKLRTRAKWLSFQSKKTTDEKIKSTFSTIHHYLEYLGKNSSTPEKKIHFQKGVLAIKGLAHDAIRKIDELKKIFHPNEKVTSVEHYEEIQGLSKFLADFENFYYDPKLEAQEIDLPGSLYSVDPKGLIKEFSHLKEDEEYELLFIRREDNLPFFSQEVLTHAKYICDFDECFLDFAQENPLKMIKVIQDEEACSVAQEIYEKVKTSLEPFLKAYKTHQEDTLSHLIYKATVALVAAKNPQNLLRSGRKKTSLEYFKDFYLYLAEITSHQLLPTLDQDPYHQKAKKVIQAMNGWFFLHPMNHPKAVEVMKSLINKGQLQPIKRHSIWSWFLESYEQIDHEMKKYPSGPIYQLIQQYENGDFDRGFSSILQGNTPAAIFEFTMNHKSCSLLYLPSPTLQSKFSHAMLLSHFETFLNLNPEKKLLIFNLQDRQFAAKARTDVIEKSEESHQNLFVVSLPKDTSFYHQEDEYHSLDNAASFIKALYDQVQGAPVSGFHFPKQISFEKIKAFSQKMIPWIHEHFFGKNKVLSRKNRQDFIEIFYGFLMMEILHLAQCDYVSFTCKDAIDIGSLSTLQFFALLKFFIHPETQLSDEDHDALVEIALVPAFIHRGRMTSIKRLERMLSCLKTFEQAYSFQSSAYKSLFDLFKGLKISDMKWLKEAA